MKENEITNALLLAASRAGARLFRQNVGRGWVGKIVRQGPTEIVLSSYRPLHAGLCTGSSDTIGWMPVTITPEMVGTQVAVFVALEVKTGRVATTPAQAAFVDAVSSAGGRAGVIRSVEEALALLK